MTDFINELREEEEGILSKIAQDYHKDCDEFDAVHLTAVLHGEPFPASDEERKMMSRNATKAMKQAVAHGCAYGYSPVDVQRAISLAAHLNSGVKFYGHKVC